MALVNREPERSGFASRRSVAMVASALAAMALAAAVAGRGCRVDEDTPAGVVRSFAEAVRADDRQAVYDHFGPRTRAWLDDAAQRATNLVGGSKRFGPLDMIGIGQGTSAAGPESIRVVEKDEAQAIIEVVTSDGQRSELTAVKMRGQWRIELPGYRIEP